MDTVYHQMSVEDVILHFQTNRSGLTDAEVRKGLEKYGPNTMPKPRSKSLAEIFLHQFLSPLIYVLIAAAVISAATGDLKDAIFIIAIIAINAILGTYQEWRAENSAAALRNLVKVKCRVRRDGSGEGMREGRVI